MAVPRLGGKVDIERSIDLSSFRRSGRPLIAAALLCLGVAGVAGAAAVVAWSLPHPLAMLSMPAPEPAGFAQRFPVDLSPSRDLQNDARLKRATAQLAEAMRAQAPLETAELPSPGNVPMSRIPIPRARPVVAGLMADYGAVSRPATAAGPLDDVSSAIRNVFAMLPPSLQLASIAPGGGVSPDGRDEAPDLSALGKQTALYDISARTVYMPDGTRLEAHSGLGAWIDDVRFVNVQDRGPTPPNVYELSYRERPFHGVQALRMKPVGDGDLFGRSGLLTHSYLMGPNGDSNGCVSFKDYDAFLKAYAAGEVKRLVVVKSLKDDTVKVARKT